MTINSNSTTSNSTTAKSTQTHEHSKDNSSIRTTVSLREFFDNNQGSAISHMAGNISRATYDTSSSLRAYGQSKNSEVTCRIIPDAELHKYQESKHSLEARKKALKMFVSLQSTRLTDEMDKLSGTGDLISHLKLKKRSLESQNFIRNLQKDIYS